MEISIDYLGENGEIALLKLKGSLDSTSYRDLIERGRQLVTGGVRNLLLDLEQVNFLSSSGIVALHNLALILRKEQPPDLENGWSAMHAAYDYAEDTPNYERHIKLLKPSLGVANSLKVAGFDRVFQIFADLDTALASFA